MKYINRISILVVILFLCSIALTVEGAEWLGEYVGSEIPGYEILKSNMLLRENNGGPTEDLTPKNAISHLIDGCKANGGRALVNVRLIYSLGEVSWEENGGSIKKIFPGAYGGVYGDCVSSVKPKK